MAISHNPIFNQAMSTGATVARIDQQAVDAEFAVSISETPKFFKLVARA